MNNTGERASGTLLVVDDEPGIRELLTLGLRFVGYEVLTADRADQALATARRRRPDALVVDVMLPDVDGFELTRRLREEGTRAPVLFLSARADTTDKITGLSLGDDYVTKPFSLEEVVARIRNLLNRQPVPVVGTTLRFHDLQLDVATLDVRRGDRPIRLSPTEFRLLRYLMRNAGRVVSKARIVEDVWECGFSRQPNIVESYISFLRRKVDREDPPLIHTLRGMGYSLRLPPG
ncbi:response regulator transcription factor [Streptoalloteichus hindustanus]|uniref:Two-component system, OmpR family, response regulator n=1 Tax=Streptoalloteichus hindustanus TaxID=2017 RepID=A0A1M5EY57_STRHI|nr:response regulator transcription factor [Streptoalloteichus hindustanus]SHF84230.1 two-component system, OmpR family, response regulator [Streptoalloteichus hindustanus]